MIKNIRSNEFYINGKWVKPCQDNAKQVDVINPANEEILCQLSLADKQDVDNAVQAANEAFASWSQSSIKKRLSVLNKIKDQYKARYEDLSQAISLEMGAPITLAKEAHVASGISHLKTTINELETFEFEQPLDGDENQHISYQAIGPCALITPWNWPLNQLALKIFPALAAGCTVVLKPSEIAPLSSIILTEIIHSAGLPDGVFNMIHGDGATTGSALTSHPDIKMISFTGSTNAGKAVMKSAADYVKKVTLELGGKSPNIVFADADLSTCVTRETLNCFGNTGQTCVAPTRMIVERSIYDEVVEMAKNAALTTDIDLPSKEGDHMGPLTSKVQFDKVQEKIQQGIDEGARLVAGGLGKPEGFEKGYFVKPTVFADVNNDMIIAREEIFGPVLAIIPFDNEEQAIKIANDTPYGLNARIQTKDMEKAQRVARQIQSGMIQINGQSLASGIPFGGVKQSGIGREGGKWGIEDYLEVRIISGWKS